MFGGTVQNLIREWGPNRFSDGWEDVKLTCVLLLLDSAVGHVSFKLMNCSKQKMLNTELTNGGVWSYTGSRSVNRPQCQLWFICCLCVLVKTFWQENTAMYKMHCLVYCELRVSTLFVSVWCKTDDEYSACTSLQTWFSVCWQQPG